MLVTRTPVILLTGKLAELIATINSLVEQSYDLLTTSLEDHHLEKHDNDPGEDTTVVRDDRQVVETQANVSEQSYYENEHDRQNKFVVHAIRGPQEHGCIRVESP